MLADYDTLNRNLNNLGLNRTDKLVFYDKSGIFSSPRAAWNMILAGHKQVFLLDHFKDYKASGAPLDTEEIAFTATDALEASLEYDIIEEEEYDQNYQKQVIEYEELFDLVKSGQLGSKYITFDARATPRFTGEAPEPREGLSSGHIPSSLSLPFNKVLTENGNYKSKQEILDLFKTEFNLDLTKPLEGKEGIIVMCGTGVTAVILRLAIESVAESKIPIRVYDGSWTEWAQRAPSEFIEKV
ncbi:sulfurtransferase [Yamadazyma tenuis]|nr:sulfurtransferase [Yamadazyma tenuis]